MPLYTTMRAPRQQMQAEGKDAPQQGNYAGGNGMYSSRPAGGAASTKPIPGLATALGGAQAQPRQQQQGPQQTSNRAFANWGEPGSAYGPPPPLPMPTGRPISTGPVNRPTVQTAQTGAATQSPVAGLPMVMQGQQAQGGSSGHGASYVGPPMMGPASGRMSLSGAMSGQNTPTHRSSMSMSPDFNPVSPVETSRWIMDNIPGYVPAVEDVFGGHPERIPRDIAAGNTGTYANNGHGSGWQESGHSAYDPAYSGGDDNRGVLGHLGREAGRAVSAFPSGFASGLNENELTNINQYYDNFSDISGLKNAGTALMDPAQQAAADAAERAQMQTGINTQRDEQLRMLMGQQGRGGMVGSGASTGLLNSALRAQALGEQNLAQDQYQRMIGREQLGGQMLSDYGRQKYGIMNDQYTSGGDIAALLFGGGKEAAGGIGSVAQGAGAGLAAILPLFL